MITINGAKELIRIDSWEDIEGRPGYDANLDPSAHELEVIIGRYAFKDKILCGLSNCKTPHTRGYIVVTKDARTTNIGKDCGSKYFGVDFDDMSRQFDRDMTNKENREKLWSFFFKFDDINSTITSLRAGDVDGRGADWVYKKSRPLLNINQGCPTTIVRRIAEMLRLGTDIVEVPREATEQEIQQMEASAGRNFSRPQYITEQAGRVGRLDVLRSENDLRELLIVNLETNLKAFAALDIDAMLPEALAHWAKWSGSVELTLQRASEAISAGKALLAADNLRPLFEILDANEKAELRVFLQSVAA
jgi:hypothetical protein